MCSGVAPSSFLSSGSAPEASSVLTPCSLVIRRESAESLAEGVSTPCVCMHATYTDEGAGGGEVQRCVAVRVHLVDLPSTTMRLRKWEIGDGNVDIHYTAIAQMHIHFKYTRIRLPR